MTARMVDSREIAPEVRHFVFEVPGLEALAYEPGQFLSLNTRVGENHITRAYSVASPSSGNRFELCLNRVTEGKFSPYLFEMKPGDAVDVTGPYGTFMLRRPVTDSILVATGTGIAPFRAMLQGRLADFAGATCTLIFGVRYEGGLLYRDEFEQMGKTCAGFHFWPTLSRPGESWRGRSGHVQNHLDEALNGRRDVTVYVCGLKAMVDDVRRILKEKGFDRKQIVYEKYD
ncbi:MAG: ferredoxin--NADP reductase [Bryobacteraceae bacterium]